MFPLLYFNFKSFLDPNSASFIRFQCILHDSGRVFSESWNFYKLKRGDVISEENQFSECLNFLARPSVFQHWKFFRPIFFTIYYISMYSAWFRKSFLRVLKFLEIRHGGPNFWGKPILQKVWIIWSPILYFSIKSFLDTNSLPWIRFQCILYDSRVILSGFSKLYKLRKGDLISGWNKFCRMSELFGPSCCISIFKVF